MKHTLIGCLSILALAVLLAPVQAEPIIAVGDWELQPNQPGQSVTFSVSGGDAVDGMNFYAQVGDGSDGLQAPLVTALDIVHGTIFSAGNNYFTSVAPHVAAAYTETLGGPVNAQGVIGTLTIDTTGYSNGSWPLILRDTIYGPTDFAGLAAQITDGRIYIAGTAGVPEPASWALWLLGVMACFLLRRLR
jgi:hypothetical protein